jgi:hypothetical protein
VVGDAVYVMGEGYIGADESIERRLATGGRDTVEFTEVLLFVPVAPPPEPNSLYKDSVRLD